MSKEMYIAMVEEIAAELEEQGLDPDKAYDIASNRAYDAMRGRLADMSDQLRKIEKERS